MYSKNSANAGEKSSLVELSRRFITLHVCFKQKSTALRSKERNVKL